MSTDMYDATHENVDHIPHDARKVAGYTSGSPNIEWTADDWKLFPTAGHVRIEQGYGGLSDAQILGCDVLDVEAGAITPAQVPAAVHLRISKGIQWTTIYGTDSTLAAVRAELIAAEATYGKRWFFGHVDCWLAHWGVSRASADALLGHEIHGLTCRAVQISNLGTTDLSVTEDNWHAYIPPDGQILHLATLAHSEVVSAGKQLGDVMRQLAEIITLAGG